jgi:hypothetical protein
VRIVIVGGVKGALPVEMGLDGLQAASKRTNNITMLTAFRNFTGISTPLFNLVDSQTNTQAAPSLHDIAVERD